MGFFGNMIREAINEDLDSKADQIELMMERIEYETKIRQQALENEKRELQAKLKMKQQAFLRELEEEANFYRNVLPLLEKYLFIDMQIKMFHQHKDMLYLNRKVYYQKINQISEWIDYSNEDISSLNETIDEMKKQQNESLHIDLARKQNNELDDYLKDDYNYIEQINQYQVQLEESNSYESKSIKSLLNYCMNENDLKESIQYLYWVINQKKKLIYQMIEKSKIFDENVKKINQKIDEIQKIDLKVIYQKRLDIALKVRLFWEDPIKHLQDNINVSKYNISNIKKVRSFDFDEIYDLNERITEINTEKKQMYDGNINFNRERMNELKEVLHELMDEKKEIKHRIDLYKKEESYKISLNNNEIQKWYNRRNIIFNYLKSLNIYLVSLKDGEAHD